MVGTKSDRVLVGWFCAAAALAWGALALVTPDEDALGPREVFAAVPAHDVPAGHVIAADDLVRVHMNREYIPLHAITDAAALAGRVTRERLLEGEVVREERLVDPCGVLVPAGMVRVLIPLPADAAAREVLQPNNFVDLLVTEGGETRTVVQAATVLGVEDAGVAVALSEDLAERLGPVLDSADQVQFGLRNDVDVTHVDANGR